MYITGAARKMGAKKGTEGVGVQKDLYKQHGKRQEQHPRTSHHTSHPSSGK